MSVKVPSFYAQEVIVSGLKRSKVFLSLAWLVLFFVGFYSFFPSSAFGSIDDIVNGAQIESGDVTFDRPDSNTLLVNASDRSIINFNSFSIGEQETVRFVQAMDSASVLGRVLGGTESRLLGTLFSNGEFVLVNPNGIFVGANANINVGSLILSTLNINSEMYRSGQYTFQKPDGFDPAKIFNEGTIKAADGGHIALLADSIENRGTIEARLGSVVLGIGKKQTLTFDSLGLMNLVVDEAVARELLGSEEAIKNAGGITADGGKVILTAKLLNDTFDHLINNEGVIQATRAEERDGKIVFVSNAGIDNSGTLDTNVLNEKGGAFHSTGTVTGGEAYYDNLDGAANISGNIGSNQTDVGDLIVDGNITLTANNLVFTADSDNNGVGKFDMNVGTQIIDGGGSYTLTLKTGENSNLRTFSVNHLILDRAGNASTPVYTLNSGLSISNLTVEANTTLSLNGSALSLGSLYNNGTIRLIGSEFLSIITSSNDTDSGTWTFVGDGDSASDTYTIKDFGSTDYYNLVINPTDSSDIFQLGGAKVYAGTLTISQGTYDANGNTTTVTGITTIQGSTSIYSAGSAKQTLNNNLVISSSGSFTGGSGNIEINGDLNLGTGTFDGASSSTTDINGNLTMSGSGWFRSTSGTTTISGDITAIGSTTIANNGIIIMDGSGTSTLSAVSNMGDDFRIDGSSKTVNLGQALSTGGLTIGADDTLNLSGYDLSASTGFSNLGTLKLYGSETLNITAGNDIDSGTWYYTGDGDGNADFYRIKDFNAGGVNDYYNLVINMTDANDTITIDQTSGDDIKTAGAFTLTRGTLDTSYYGLTVAGAATVNGGTLSDGILTGYTFGSLTFSSGNIILSDDADTTLDINGNFNMSGGVFTATTLPITISGNFTHSAGTFNHNNGTITLDGGNQTVSGSTTFFNLKKQDLTNNSTDLTLTFDNTGTQTIEGTLTLQGTDTDDRVNLVSDSPGTRWELNCSTCTLSISWVETTDSDASGGSLITHSNTISGGNNVNWGFGITTTWTGASSSVWSLAGNWNNGTPGAEDTAIIADVTTDPILDTSISIYSLTINTGGLLTLSGNNLTLNGGAFSNNGTVALRGTETITGVTQDTNSGTWRYVGISDATQNTYSIKDFGSTDYYNLEISALDTDIFNLGAASVVAGTLTVTAGTYGANGNTTTATGLVTVSGGTYLASSANQTFNAGLTVSGGTFTGSSGDVDVNGTVTTSSGTLTAPSSGSFTVSGNWAGNGGTLTNNSGTVTFDGSGTQTVDEVDSFYNLTHSGSGTLQLTSNSITVGNVLTNSGGTFDLNGQGITFQTGGANFSNTAIFKLIGSETITNITQDTDSGTWLYVGDGDSAADTFTIKDFGTTDYYNLTINSTDSNDTYQLGGAKSVAGALTVTSGTYDANGNTTTATGLTTVNGGTYQSSTATQTFNAGLTVSSGTFTGSSGTVDVNGALTHSGGTLTAPSGNLQITGDFDNSGGSFSNNSGTIIFDGTSNQTFTTNGGAYNHLTLNNGGASGSDRLIVSGNLDVNGNLTITDGDLRLSTNNPSVNTAGNVSVAAAGSVTKGSGTWTFDGSGTSTLAGNSQDFGTVTVDGSSKTLQLTTSAATFGTFTIGADDIFDANGVNATISTLSNNNIFQLQGSETITLTNNDTDSGTWKYVGDGDSAADTFTIKDFGSGTDYYNLTINSTDAADIYQSGAAKTIAGALAVTNGIYNVNGNTTAVTGAATVNGGTYQSSTATQTFNSGLTVSSGTFTGSSGTVDVNGALTYSGGTFTAPSGNLQVSGNFASTGGSFSHNNGTVVLDGTSQTISGSTTFNNLTKTVSSADTLAFAQGTTQIIAGTLTLQGVSGNLLSLHSSADNNTWNIDPQGTVNVDYLDVKDSNNMNTLITVAHGNDSLGNTGWTFLAGGGGGGGGSEEGGDEGGGDYAGEIDRGNSGGGGGGGGNDGDYDGGGNSGNSGGDGGSGNTGSGGNGNGNGGGNTGGNSGGNNSGNGGNNGKSSGGKEPKKIVTYVFVEEGAVNVDNGDSGTMVYPGENIKYGADGQKKLQTRGVYVVTGDQVKSLRRTKYSHEAMKGEFRWAENPSALAASHDGSTVFVVLPKAGKVATINTQNQELGRDIRGLDDGANNILMSPDDKLAFVTDNVKDEIMVMNIKEQKIERTIQTRPRPAGIQVTGDGKTLFVANEWDGSISQIDSASGKETGVFPAGKAPYALALSKDEKQLYATDRTQGKVMVFERGADGSFKLQKEIQVGDAPTDIALAPEGGILFVTNRNSRTVAVVDSKEGKVLQFMAVGERPTAITIVPEGNYAYVANELSGTISHLDLGSRKVIEDIPAGTAPRRVVISTPPQRIVHPKAA